MESIRAARRGLVAGAAGTVALNAVTYLDMAVRGRPASSVPAEAAQRLAGMVGLDLAPGGDEDTRANRSEGLGALLGFVSGLGMGLAYGLAMGGTGRVSLPAGAMGLTAVAMVGANGPATVAGVTDPRRWGVEGWVADIVPHLAYGFVTAAVHDVVR